jgi:hypothetical protein
MKSQFKSSPMFEFASFNPRQKTAFGLSLSFDKLRMIGNSNRQHTTPIPFGLSLSKPCLRLRGHFDKLSANGVG